MSVARVALGAAERREVRRKSWGSHAMTLLTSTDHKVIANMYFVTAFAFFGFGGLLALARLSSSWLLSSLAWSYIWLFRSLPLIVVLIILYNFSYLYDTLSLGIPFTGVTWASYQTINVLGQFSTGAERLYRGDYSRRLPRR